MSQNTTKLKSLYKYRLWEVVFWNRLSDCASPVPTAAVNLWAGVGRGLFEHLFAHRWHICFFIRKKVPGV